LAEGRVGVNGIELYYETIGNGDPLLLIEGLGYATWMWYRQRDCFGSRYRTVLFDNRCTGRSDKPDRSFTIADMASDAAGLIEVLETGSVHVLGVSMGGFIAQELALNHPRLVRTLALCCTSFGGSKAAPITPQALESMTSVADLSPEEVIRRGLSAAFSQEYFASHPTEVERIVAWRLASASPRRAWQRQFQSVLSFCSEDRLEKIAVPTLVMAGDHDLVVPVQNAYALAQRITGSELAIFPGGGHLFFIEQAERFNDTVLDFLDRQG
jgi:pimeloyl-ACP methyl ester carboxylesterase